MCLLAALDSQGIVVKCTAAIFFRTVDSRWRRLPQRLKTRDAPSYISLSSRLHIAADNGNFTC